MPRKQPPRSGTARNVQPVQHDPYRAQRKTGESIVCDQCGVVCHDGRWYWGTPPVGNDAGGLCPACQRIRDRYPAGTLRLHGLPERYRDEVLGLVRNAEEREKAEHPLERLMEVEDGGDGVVVTTTGTHLARSIASALKRRFHGGIAIRYVEGETLVRVDWTGPAPAE